MCTSGAVAGLTSTWRTEHQRKNFGVWMLAPDEKTEAKRLRDGFAHGASAWATRFARRQCGKRITRGGACDTVGWRCKATRYKVACRTARKGWRSAALALLLVCRACSIA